VQTDEEHVRDVVVEREARAGMAHELIVQRDAPPGVELETTHAQREDLLHGIERLLELARRLFVHVEVRTRRRIDLADVLEAFAAGDVSAGNLVTTGSGAFAFA